MPEQTDFEGGFERTYENGMSHKVTGTECGFIEIEHSQLDKPLKIHSSAIRELAENAVEDSGAHYII